MPKIPQTEGCAYPRTSLWRAGSTSGRDATRMHMRRFGFVMGAGSAQPSGLGARRCWFCAAESQGVHRHCCERAGQEVGVEFGAEQALQVHIGLELGMKLLMRGMAFVQINDLSVGAFNLENAVERARVRFLG